MIELDQMRFLTRIYTLAIHFAVPSSPTTSVASSVDSGTQPMPSSSQALTVSAAHVPEVSYSSSEDEDFFDAEDDVAGSG